MDLVDTQTPAVAASPEAGGPFGSTRALRGWALASVVANCLLIVTGAVVRLSGSGLGCPTWPRCDDSSYVPQGATSYHPYIEFGNRLLTFVLMAIAAAVAVTAIRSRASQKVRLMAWIGLVGIPFQGVIGGITVLTHLNPWVVALHLLLSIALIVLATWVLQEAHGLRREVLPVGLSRLVTLLFWVLMVAIWLGTVVTGAGPHSGDNGAKRNNLEILQVARIHALSVWVAVGLTAILLWQFRTRGLARAARWAVWLLAAELLQGAIGYAQFFLGLPLGLVICHMAGITLVTVAVSWLWFGTRRRGPASLA